MAGLKYPGGPAQKRALVTLPGFGLWPKSHFTRQSFLPKPYPLLVTQESQITKLRKPSMNPTKIVANTAAMSSKEQGEEWQQPKGPCRFQQLPEALVMDILSSLSVNNLFNCRCVCKSWLSIISDPQFTHLHRSRSPIGILIQHVPMRKKSMKSSFTKIVESAGSDIWVEEMRLTPTNSIPMSGLILINSCNGLLLFCGATRDDPWYVCNPILGEFITIPPTRKGRYWASFVGLGFRGGTNEYKVLQTFFPLDYSSSNNYFEAEIYTIGTGVWRSIGNVPMEMVTFFSNSFLHGALHWVRHTGDISVFIHSFNFEREQFIPVPLPPPSYFGPIEKKYSYRLKLGVLGGCLLLCVFDVDSSKFDMWVMKDYGVQESWTKTLVIENLYPRELSFDSYEPIMFLSNGKILMLYNYCSVVCYDQERKSFQETRIAHTKWHFRAIAYSPSFVSLYDVSKGDEVKRVRDNKKSDKLFAEGSYH